MKTLKKFVNDLNIVNEWYTSTTHTPEEVAANLSTDDSIQYVWMGYGKNVIPAEDMDDLIGKDEYRNGSHGRFEMYPKKTDDEAVRALPKEEQTANQAYVIRQINHNQDFFIQGKRGWGKSSIIKKAATNRGRSVIVVYLNGADEQDLAGIAIPAKYKGETTQDVCIPAWAAYIINHPDEDFLLFFDEMNQATPAVLNKIMAMAEKGSRSLCGTRCDNFIVGGAGNFEDENRGLQDMSYFKPLLARMYGVHTWEDTEEEWKASYSHWMSDPNFVQAVGKDLIDTLYSYKDIFGNPRTLEYFMKNTVEDIEAVKKYPDDAWVYTAKEIYKDIIQNVEQDDEKDGKTGRFKAKDTDEKAKKLAQYLADYIQRLGTGVQQDVAAKHKKNRVAILEGTAEMIKSAITNGYIVGEGDTYIVAEDNGMDMIAYLFGTWSDEEEAADESYPREALEQFVNGLLKKGTKYAYKTAKEAEKAIKEMGYEGTLYVEAPEIPNN